MSALIGIILYSICTLEIEMCLLIMKLDRQITISNCVVLNASAAYESSPYILIHWSIDFNATR